MKKILSFTLALCMMITSLFTGMFAMADTAKPTTAQIKEKITGAANYLVTNDSSYTVSNAVDFLTLLKSGKDMSNYKDAFVQSVKDNLDANGAKLALTSESPALYGAVILDLKALGYDPASFEGYNLVSSFSQVDLENNSDNPYYYRVTLEAAKAVNMSGDFIKKVCAGFISDYYVMGSGLNYYGYSCDNTAMFVVTMAPYYTDYKVYVDDALKLLETYKTTGGYFSNTEYGPDANADSTALALAAYSAMGDVNTAEQIYTQLCAFESGQTGVFTYDGETASAYATKDALFGLETFLAALPACYDGHTYTAVVTAPTCTEKGYTTYTCSVCGDTYRTNELNATGHNFGSNAAKCSVCGTANPNYTVPQLTGLAVKSKSTSAIRLTWDKVADAESYIVYQYNDTSKKYDKIATVKNTASSYKVSGLTAGGIYKFRMSVVVNGKEGKKSDYLKTSTNPKKASILSLKSNAKKRVTVKIKTLNCTGYQIQLSTSKNFSSIYKTRTVTVSKTTTKTIGALSGKTYYVRVRSFTKAGGTKQYGKWSEIKAVKVK